MIGIHIIKLRMSTQPQLELELSFGKVLILETTLQSPILWNTLWQSWKCREEQTAVFNSGTKKIRFFFFLLTHFFSILTKVSSDPIHQFKTNGNYCTFCFSLRPRIIQLNFLVSTRHPAEEQCTPQLLVLDH